MGHREGAGQIHQDQLMPAVAESQTSEGQDHVHVASSFTLNTGDSSRTCEELASEHAVSWNGLDHVGEWVERVHGVT